MLYSIKPNGRLKKGFAYADMDEGPVDSNSLDTDGETRREKFEPVFITRAIDVRSLTAQMLRAAADDRVMSGAAITGSDDHRPAVNFADSFKCGNEVGMNKNLAAAAATKKLFGLEEFT